MEPKKQLLIKVLQKLQPYRNLAEGILALVESRYCTDKTLDGLIVLLQDSIKIVKKDQEKDKLEKGLALIQKIRHQEEDEHDQMTDEDLEKLLWDSK